MKGRGKVEINNMWGKKVPESLLKKAVLLTLAREGKKGEREKEVSLVLVPSSIMKELNLKFKRKSSLTDVLAFPFREEVGPAKELLGEVVVCPDVAVYQAEERGHSLEDELLLLVIHGVLHLLGYRDDREEERKLMEEKERGILKLLGRKENIV